MGKIVVSENVTLDGVIQDPAGDEGFRACGWAGLIGNSLIGNSRYSGRTWATIRAARSRGSRG